MEKKCKKAKWLSGEDLQIVVKRREAKSKGEKERYKHLNAEFQRIARRDKKAFLSDQCKEIEENNRMGKTRDLFKKIRDTKGTFHAKMSLIKDRNGMDLTEAEDIKKKWQPTSVLLPGKSHGRRSLVGFSPWGRKESDMTERLHFYFSLSCTGEGNGNPLQCSCLENPRDGRAWWAAISGVAQSRIRLK